MHHFARLARLKLTDLPSHHRLALAAGAGAVLSAEDERLSAADELVALALPPLVRLRAVALLADARQVLNDELAAELAREAAAVLRLVDAACPRMAATAVPAGDHQVRMEFAYDGGGLGKGGTATLYIDGNKVGEGPIAATVPMLYSGDETCDVGYDSGTPVSDDYTSQNGHFNGTIKWVQLDGTDDHDHLISDDERLRIAMALQ